MTRAHPALLLLLAVSLAPQAAFARFGKASTPADTEREAQVEAARKPAKRARAHAASAVERSRRRAGVVYAPRVRARPYHRPYRRYGYGFWAVPAPGYAVQAGAPEEAEQPASFITAQVGADGQLFRDGASLGLNLGVEGDRFGFTTQFTGIFVAADDGSGATDSIKLWNAHVSFALLSGEYGRLRLEGGLHTAFAPSMIALGPGLGLSGMVHLFGPVGLEASVRATPFPFRQLDASAAVTLGLGRLGLRAGWRRIYLNDAGLVDGIVHDDLFDGPFLGLALTL